MRIRPWLIYAIVTTTFWGVWGALIEIPEKAGFPATLGYSVWAVTMIIPAVAALKIIGWKLEYSRNAIFLGLVIGFLGAGGQVILFQALRTGPAYLVFPFISLSPVITILLSYVFLKGRAYPTSRVATRMAGGSSGLSSPCLSSWPGVFRPLS